MPFYFLKFEGDTKIEGLSDTENHVGEIPVKSFAFGQIQEARDGAQQKNVVTRDLIVRFSASKASPLLYQACAGAAPFTKVTLTFVKTVNNKTEDVQKWILEGNVIISQYKQVGSENEVEAMQPSSFTDVKGLSAAQAIGPVHLNAPEPFEEIQLSFKKAALWYRQEKDGKLDAAVGKGWDKNGGKPYEAS